MRGHTLALVTVVLAGAVAPVATAADGSGSGYAGTYVSYDTEGSAIVDYSVRGETVVESVRVRSSGEADGDLSVGASADLAPTADGVASALSVTARSETTATIRTEGGATVETHDDDHGSLVVRTDEGSRTVAVGVAESATTDVHGDDHVVVRTDDGAEAAVVVAGDGRVEVGDGGNVTATVEEDGTLLVRTYPDGRSESERARDRLVAGGTAAAGVSLTAANGATLADAVTYETETTVAVTERSAERVAFEVERTSHRGRVVVVSVGEGALTSTDDLRVTVDGQAAAEASSTAELRRAADGGETSKYLVRQRTDARGGADVFVALNHFSTRTVAVADGSDADGSTATPASDAETAEPTEGGDSSIRTAARSSSDSSDGSEHSSSRHRLTLAALVTLAASVLARGL